MRVETISYLKQNTAISNVEEPIVVTQNGKPACRIESEVSAQLKDEGIALLKLTNLAEREVTSGKLIAQNKPLALPNS